MRSLKDQELLDVIEGVKAGDQASAEKLIKNYHPFVVSTMNKRFGKYTCVKHGNDLIQSGYVGLIEAAHKYDPKRGTYATCAYWYLLKNFYDYIKTYSMVEEGGYEANEDEFKYNHAITEEEGYEEVEVQSDAQTIIEDIRRFHERGVITAQQLDIVITCVYGGMSYSDYAELHNCSRQNICQQANIALDRLRKVLIARER